MKEFTPAKTVQEVRKALRDAIFNCTFMAGMHKTEGNAADEDKFRQLACNFAAFGVNSNMFTFDEANLWLDGIWDKKVLVDVVMEADKIEYPEAYRSAAIDLLSFIASKYQVTERKFLTCEHHRKLADLIDDDSKWVAKPTKDDKKEPVISGD